MFHKWFFGGFKGFQYIKKEKTEVHAKNVFDSQNTQKIGFNHSIIDT